VSLNTNGAELIVLSKSSQIEVYSVVDQHNVYKKIVKQSKKKMKKVRKAEEMENPDQEAKPD
jgi:hypothetical protein